MPEEASYSGIEPIPKKRNPLFSGIIFEALFLGVIVITVISVFLYFKVIPNTIFGTDTITPTPISQKPIEPRVIATSKNPDYELIISDEKVLVDVFKEWGIYGKELKNTYGTSNGPINTIEIVIENKPVQPGVDDNTVYVNNMPITSQYKISNQRIILPFHFPTQRIEKTISPSDSLLKYFITTAYAVSHDISTPEKIKEGEVKINRALNILRYTKEPYFNFTKKNK